MSKGKWTRPSSVAVTTVGYDKLRRALQRMIDDRSHFKKVHADVAAMLVTRAKAEAPYRTGDLQASIKPRATMRSAGMRAGGTKRVPYAAAIHWGWPRHHIVANPFMERATQASISEGVTMMNEGLIKALESYGWKLPAEGN